MSKKEERIYPGELLKEARKKTRRKYKRFSSELGIPEGYLEALEENNFSIFAGPTYIKGYLRAYAKKLDLDSETVIVAFDRYLKDQKRLKEKSIKQKQKKENKKKFFYIYLLIFLFIASITTLIVFISERNNNSDKKEDISSYTETRIQESDDAKVSLASTTNVKTNVSCLVLPEGRCSEFTLSN